MSDARTTPGPGRDVLAEAREHMAAFQERAAGTLAACTVTRPGLADWSLGSIGPVLVALAKGAGPPRPKRRFSWGGRGQRQQDVDPATLEAAAYYLGECFVRTFAALSWNVLDDPELDDYGAPVVTGFADGDHLLVARVGDVLVHRARDRGAHAVTESVDFWRERVPAA